MVAAVVGGPALGPVLAVGENVGGLEVAVRHLRGEDDGDPALEGGVHVCLGGEDFGVTSGVDHEGDAHGFDGLVDPGVREDVALVAGVGLAAVGLAGFDEVVDAAVALVGGDVGAFAVGDAVRDPVNDESFGAGAPERAVDGVFGGVDDVEAVFGRRSFDVDLQRGDGLPGAAGTGEMKDVLARS